MTPPALDPAAALFLDFDGTLTPLVDDPDRARLSAPQQALLERVARSLGGALCLISGRALDDLAARSPATLWRAGGHGMDVAPPGAGAAPRPATPARLLAALAPVLAAFPSARLEAKGEVIAIHYRAAPGTGPALGRALRAALADLDSHRLHGGKMLWELKPEGRDKGAALRRLMQAPPFQGRRPLMVGDDVTDEDGFRAALALGGSAIKVGAGVSVAPLRLPGVAAVWRWLEEAPPMP